MAVDFSHWSQKLVEHAFRLRTLIGATIYLVYVIEATCTMEAALREAYFSESLSRMRDWAMNQFVNLTPTEWISDQEVHRIVDVGRPGATIAQVAKGVRADLVMVGLQDHSRTEKRLIDAHTEQLLRNEGTTILTLPA